MCDRAVVLDHGRLACTGDVDHAVGAYHELLAARSTGEGSVTVDLPAHRVTAGAPLRCTVRAEVDGRPARARLILATTQVPVVADIAVDPHFAARGSIVEVDGVPMQGLVARLSATPGRIRWPGPPLGGDPPEWADDQSESQGG